MAYVTKNLECGESFKWKAKHEEEMKRRKHFQKTGKGYSSDGNCHIDGKPCKRSKNCEFTCLDVCASLDDDANDPSLYCRGLGCSRKKHIKFKCMLRDCE